MHASLFSSSFSHSIILFFYGFYWQLVAVASYVRCNLKDIDYVLPSLFEKKIRLELDKMDVQDFRLEISAVQ